MLWKKASEDFKRSECELVVGANMTHENQEGVSFVNGIIASSSLLRICRSSTISTQNGTLKAMNFLGCWN